jgi:deoxyribonuclease-4
MILGSHRSIAGGLANAVLTVHRLGLQAVGLFVRNQRQWAAPPLTEQAVKDFRNARRRLGIGPAVAHGSYLVNLAGSDEVREKSIAALSEDLERSGGLGIEYLVVHPGSHPDRAEGIARISAGIERAFAGTPRRRVKLLLENTAGQGHSIGQRFEELAEIRRRCSRRGRVGVCLDTAHAFAAGYDLRTPRACSETLARLDDVVGLEHLLAVHLNDSKKPLASHVDRHEHIGLGAIGQRGFAALMQDERLAELAGILETPKETHPDGRDWDVVNAELLRRLAK